MEEIYGISGELVIGILMLLLFIVFILVITLFVKLRKLRSNYVKVMNGTGVQDLEGLLIRLQEQLNVQSASDEQQKTQLQRINQQLRSMKSYVGVHRYNAFSEQGSDLSFSVAIVDQSGDGVVFSGIHGREETYIYAKPLKERQSTYTLTPEEKEAITRALASSSTDIA